MSAIVEAVVDAVEDVAEAVGDVVEDVVDVVENVVETVVENPEILIIAVAAPYAISAIGTAMGASAATIAAVTQPITAAAITASQGGDIEDIGRAALTAYIAPQVGRAAGTAAANAGLQNSLANVVGGAAGSATAAAITGGDVAQSALAGGVSSGVSSGVREFGIDQGLSQDTARLIGNVAGSTAGGAVSGNAEAGATSALLGELNRELRRLSEQEVDIGFGPGRFTPEYTAEDVVGMPEEDFDRMMKAIEEDVSQREREQIDQFTPDYSLTAGSTRREAEGMGGAQGLRGRLRDLREGEPVDYERIFEGEFGGEGLRVPRVPGLDSMGGGTGLTVPRQGETVTEEGVIPEDQILRDIQEEMYPTPDFEGETGVAREPTDLSSIQLRVVREPMAATQRGETPGISPRVTGEAGASILGEKEPLFGGDEDEQRAVWNRRSLRLRRALGL
jgi:hypothetical protein